MIIKDPNQEKINRIISQLESEGITAKKLGFRPHPWNNPEHMGGKVTLDDILDLQISDNPNILDSLITQLNEMGLDKNKFPTDVSSRKDARRARNLINLQNILSPDKRMGMNKRKGGFDMPVLSALLSFLGLGSKKKEPTLTDLSTIPKDYLENY